MALHTLLDNHLQKIVGTAGYTVAGATATVTTALDHRRMQELVDVASQIKHDVKLVGGALQVLPR